MVRASDRPFCRQELVDKEVPRRDDVDELALWVPSVNSVDGRASSPFGDDITEVQRLAVRGG